MSEKQVCSVEGELIGIAPESPLVVHKECGVVFHLLFRAAAVENSDNIACPCCGKRVAYVRETAPVTMEVRQEFDNLYTPIPY